MIELQLFQSDPQNVSDRPTCSAQVSLHETELALRYRWQSKDAVKLEALGPLERKHDLWQKTCFEFFLAPFAGNAHYWEFNISSSGAWNAYEFDEYRQPQPPREHDRIFLLHFHRETQEIEARFSVPDVGAGWEGSLTAILRTEKETHYFAAHHAGAKPDFHLRKSFVIKKSGEPN